jgi:hypothetical protein
MVRAAGLQYRKTHGQGKSGMKIMLTLHPSHVMAPKWKPDDGAPHTLHGICRISDDKFGPPEE